MLLGGGLLAKGFGGGGSSFSPHHLPSLAAWYQFNTGITKDGSNLVSKWADQSGNGRDLNQATGTNQPTWQTDGTILFDGTDNFLQTDAFTLNQPTTIYLLVKQVTWTNSRYLCDGVTLNTGVVQQRTNSTEIDIYSGAYLGSPIALALDTYGVISAVFNGASSSLQLNNGTINTGNPGAGNMGGFTMGANGNGLLYGNVQYKEAIIYSVAHSAALRKQVVNYLLSI